MPPPDLTDVSPRTWVYLSFDVEEDASNTQRRGRLSIQFVEPEHDFVHFSLRRVECWSKALFSFTVYQEQLSSEHQAEVAENEAQTNRRVATSIVGGYQYLSWTDQRQIPRGDGDRWVESYDGIAETMSAFTRQITFTDAAEVRPHNPLPEPFASSRVWTLNDTPTVQVWASEEEWTQLHHQVLRMPDLPEMAPTFVNDSLMQVTEGMVRVFGDRTHRRSNDVICPYRLNGSHGSIRFLPRWIHSVCQFHDEE